MFLQRDNINATCRVSIALKYTEFFECCVKLILRLTLSTYKGRRQNLNKDNCCTLSYIDTMFVLYVDYTAVI